MSKKSFDIEGIISGLGNRVSGNKPSSSGGSNPRIPEAPKPKMNLIELKKVKTRIDEKLFSKENSELANALIKCTTIQKEIGYLQPISAEARKITDAYCQPGRIRDMLLKFIEFVEGADSIKNIEIARAKGYCNYIFYVENEIKKLIESGCIPEENEEGFTLKLTKGDVLEFIEDNCTYIQGLCKLVLVKKQAEEILCKPKSQISRNDYLNYCSIMDIANDIDSLSESSVSELIQIEDSINSQRDAIKRNILDAKEIYKMVTECITQDWIDSINSELEDCPLNTMDILQIKSYLRTRVDIVRPILEKFAQ